MTATNLVEPPTSDVRHCRYLKSWSRASLHAGVTLTLLLISSASVSADPTSERLSARFMQVDTLKLVAVGRMMDGGSLYWELRDQDGSSYWVIPRMGIGAQKPWRIDLIAGKRPDGGFGKSVPVVAESDLEKKLVALLESASKKVDPQSPSAALMRARLDVLIGLLNDRWSHPRPLRLESNGRLEERYE